jgi:N-acetyl sugar amidotransferase
MTETYTTCTRCIMDTTDSSITFDEKGVCNHCLKYDEVVNSYPFNSPASIDLELQKMITRTQKNGEGKPYDCVIGVSGGVDSTYLAYIAKEKGLRPIAVHLDNGWNSELAVHNIEKVLKNLGIDLLTHVLEWDEFKDLQIAFLKASVSDAEIPTDHAISGILYKVARKYGIKTILLGTNISTESGLPFSWTYGVSDWMYINGIHKKFGTRKLTNYPHFSFFDEVYWKLFCGIKVFPILDFVPYNKADALDVLQNKLGWQYYGGKHYESIYTRFFQGYILPKKFNIDKRKAHYSSLIRSGQIAREKALEEMAAPTYPEDMQRDDREYVIKKFGLTEQEFDGIMAAPVKSYRDYPNYYNLASKSIGFEQARKIVRRLRSL